MMVICARKDWWFYEIKILIYAENRTRVHFFFRTFGAQVNGGTSTSVTGISCIFFLHRIFIKIRTLRALAMK